VRDSMRDVLRTESGRRRDSGHLYGVVGEQLTWLGSTAQHHYR